MWAQVSAFFFFFNIYINKSVWVVLETTLRELLVAQMVKNLPAIQETQVQPLGWKDSLEKGMATHYSILAWKNPLDRGAWRAIVHGVTKSQT